MQCFPVNNAFGLGKRRGWHLRPIQNLIELTSDLRVAATCGTCCCRPPSRRSGSSWWTKRGRTKRSCPSTGPSCAASSPRRRRSGSRAFVLRTSRRCPPTSPTCESPISPPASTARTTSACPATSPHPASGSGVEPLLLAPRRGRNGQRGLWKRWRGRGLLTTRTTGPLRGAWRCADLICPMHSKLILLQVFSFKVLVVDRGFLVQSGAQLIILSLYGRNNTSIEMRWTNEKGEDRCSLKTRAKLLESSGKRGRGKLHDGHQPAPRQSLSPVPAHRPPSSHGPCITALEISNMHHYSIFVATTLHTD